MGTEFTAQWDIFPWMERILPRKGEEMRNVFENQRFLL